MGWKVLVLSFYVDGWLTNQLTDQRQAGPVIATTVLTGLIPMALWAEIVGPTSPMPFQ